MFSLGSVQVLNSTCSERMLDVCDSRKCDVELFSWTTETPVMATVMWIVQIICFGDVGMIVEREDGWTV